MLDSFVVKTSDRLRKKTAVKKYNRPHSYGATFVAQAKAIKKRDGHKCVNCGWCPPKHFRWLLHAHHELPRWKGGRDVQSNLSCICVECHVKQHPNNKFFAEKSVKLIALIKKIKRSQGFRRLS